MPTFLRIADARLLSRDIAPTPPEADYVSRLIKLIPAEVVGLYLAGAGAIQGSYPPAGLDAVPRPGELLYWWLWTGFCLAAVVVFRAWATTDRRHGLSAEWPAVAIATVSFLIWVFSLGHVFVVMNRWSGLAAALLMIAWTFVVPLFYRDHRVPVLEAGPLPPARPAPDAKGWEGRVTPTIEMPQPAPDLEPARAVSMVLDAAEDIIGRRPSASEKVAKAFTDDSDFRQLLGGVQVALHGMGIPLYPSQLGGKESETLRKGAYNGVADWIYRSIETWRRGQS